MISDEEFVDVGESNRDNSLIVLSENVNKARGKDVLWIEIKRFPTEESFACSDIKKQLEQFSKRKSRPFSYGIVENYCCKISRKKGFAECPLQYRVVYASSSFEIIVECNDLAEKHIHEKVSITASKTFIWSQEQLDVIKVGVANNSKPTVIRRNLEQAVLFSDKVPTKVQLYNKIANVKKAQFPYSNISTSSDLRNKITLHQNEPA